MTKCGQSFKIYLIKLLSNLEGKYYGKNTREVVDGILKVGAGITFVYGLAATIVGAALVSNTDAYQEKVEAAKVQPTAEYVQTLNESDDIVKILKQRR